MAPVAAHAWPEDMPLALEALASAQGLAVIRIDWPGPTSRPTARAGIRAALCATVAAYLGQPVSTIALRSIPGQALVLDAPDLGMGLSISHEAGTSLAALHVHGAVGLDVLRVDQDALPDWAQVAHDYLGPAAHARLARRAPAHRAAAFAQEWSRLEACLKCLGVALTEWTPALAQELASCHVRALDLPAPWCGALALPAQGSQSSARM